MRCVHSVLTVGVCVVSQVRNFWHCLRDCAGSCVLPFVNVPSSWTLPPRYPTCYLLVQ